MASEQVYEKLWPLEQALIEQAVGGENALLLEKRLAIQSHSSASLLSIPFQGTHY